MASPTKDIFNREGKEIVDQIRSLLSSSGANATGKTAASLAHEATDERLLVTGGAAFGTNRRGIGFVAGGRAQGGIPPFQNIAEWAVARGIVSDPRTGKKTINAIRFKIAREGSSLFRKNVTRDIYQSVITDDAVDEILNEVSGVFAQNILSTVVQSFKQA